MADNARNAVIAAFISSLPRVPLNEFPEDLECVICSRNFAATHQPVRLPCSAHHILCGESLQDWLSAAPTPNCPFCRSPLTNLGDNVEPNEVSDDDDDEEDDDQEEEVPEFVAVPELLSEHLDPEDLDRLVSPIGAGNPPPVFHPDPVRVRWMGEQLRSTSDPLPENNAPILVRLRMQRLVWRRTFNHLDMGSYHDRGIQDHAMNTIIYLTIQETCLRLRIPEAVLREDDEVWESFDEQFEERLGSEEKRRRRELSDDILMRVSNLVRRYHAWEDQNQQAPVQP